MYRLIFGALAAVAFVRTMPCSIAQTSASKAYWVCTSNESSGDVSVIDGSNRQVIATIAVGKRPRGVHASPEGKLLYVAVSGSPITGPPKLNEKGIPIFETEKEDEGDRTADGIGVIDLHQRKFLRKLPAGTDPEEFAVSPDGKRLYVSNEDVGTASVLDVGSGKVEGIVRVKKEPEGVAFTPNGKFVFVTCETGGEVMVIDAATNKVVDEILVGGRPRTIAFLADSSRAYIPSETESKVTEVDCSSRKLIRSFALPHGSRPMGTATSPDGRRIYVSTGRGGTVCVIDLSAGKVSHTISAGARPWGIGLSPDGKLLFVANGPSNDISVIDTMAAKEIDRIKVGRGPWGVAVIPVNP
ncbi:MAG: beta-propeller fold lactonase family protein [Gemmataceae bacterium]